MARSKTRVSRTKPSNVRRPSSKRDGATSRRPAERSARSEPPLAATLIDPAGVLAPGRIADAFGMSKVQLAETVGLKRETFDKPCRARAPKTQARVREMLVSRVADWAGGSGQAMAWYRAQPIPAFGGRTAEFSSSPGRPRLCAIISITSRWAASLEVPSHGIDDARRTTMRRWSRTSPDYRPHTGGVHDGASRSLGVVEDPADLRGRARVRLRRAGPGADLSTKTIKLVVPFGPGGPTDVAARVVAQVVPSGLGQSVVIENRPGAGGALGSKSVAGAEPDGYTLLIGTSATLGVVPALVKNPGYDPIRSFAPVAKIADSTTILVVHPSFPASSNSRAASRTPRPIRAS